jgi:hypothetical protein
MSFLEDLNQVNCMSHTLARIERCENEFFVPVKKPLRDYGLEEVPFESASALVVVEPGSDLIVHHSGKLEGDRSWVSHREDTGKPISFMEVEDFVREYEKPGERRVVGVRRK